MALDWASSSSSSSAWRRTYSTDPGPNAGVGFEYGLTTAASSPAGIIACKSDCGGTGWKDIYNMGQHPSAAGCT